MNTVDWTKVLGTLWHLGLLIAQAYLAAHPDYAWLSPALQAAGQMSAPPTFGVKKEADNETHHPTP